jgi:hypothetical protein
MNETSLVVQGQIQMVSEPMQLIKYLHNGTSRLAYHNKPRGLGCISDTFQRASIDIWLHFKVE